MEIPQTLKSRKQAFLPKVKTGCLTCKKRKVKCDETKPHCRRCTSTGRVCSGYQPSRDSSAASTPSPGRELRHGISTWLESDVERRSFRFFQTKAGHQLGGFFQDSFWTREVLQTAIQHASIRHLVVALGAAYERFESSDPDFRFALEQCNRSIRQLAETIAPDGANGQSSAQDIEKMYCALTASVLFTVFASLQCHVPSATSHVRAGLRVLRELEERQRSKPGSPSMVFPVPLHRLRSILTSFYGQLRSMINDEAKIEWDTDPLVSEVDRAPYFLSLDDAQKNVESLFNNTLAFMQKIDLRPPRDLQEAVSVRAQQKSLTLAVESSRKALESFIERQSTQAAEHTDPKAINVLRLYLTLLTVRLEADDVLEPTGREEAFDSQESHFGEMMSYIRSILQDSPTATGEPVYCAGFGIIMPLHMVAARCRHPTYREEAVNLLLRAGRREGLWDSAIAGKVASMTVRLEQQRAKSLSKVGSTRVKEVKLVFDGERGARLVYIMDGLQHADLPDTQADIQW